MSSTVTVHLTFALGINIIDYAAEYGLAPTRDAVAEHASSSFYAADLIPPHLEGIVRVEPTEAAPSPAPLYLSTTPMTVVTPPEGCLTPPFVWHGHHPASGAWSCQSCNTSHPIVTAGHTYRAELTPAVSAR